MAEAPDPSDAPEPRPRQGRWGRRIVITLAAAVLAVVLGVALAPRLLSTGPGTGLLAAVMTQRIPGSVQIRDASLRWIGGQSLRGVVLRDVQGEPVLHLSRFEAPDVGLLTLAMGGRDLGRVRVHVQEAHIRQVAGGPTNLARAVGAGEPSAAEPGADESGALDELSMQLEMTAERVVYESPDAQPVELSNLMATAGVPSLQDMRIELHSDLRQGGERGRLDADLSLRGAFADDGTVSLAGATLAGVAKVTNLPVAMVDRLAELGGKLTALLGDRLTATIRADGQLDGISARVVAHSPRLDADVQLVSEAGAVRATGGSHATLRVTPDSFAALLGGDAEDRAPAQGGDALVLVEPFTLAMSLDELTLPRTGRGQGRGRGVAIGRAAVEGAVTAGDIVLNVPGQGRVTLRDVSLEVSSARLSDVLTARLSAAAALAGERAPIDAELSIRNLGRADRPVEASLHAEALPVALADAAAQQDGRLVHLLGDALDARVQATLSDAGVVAFTGHLSSPNLDARVEGSYGDDGSISLETVEPIRLTLTPAAYADWMTPEDADQPRLALVEAQPILIGVTDFQLAYRRDDPSRIDTDRSHLVARVSIPAAVLHDTATGERLTIEQGVLKIDAPTLNQAVQLLANFKIGGGGDAEPGVIESQTRVHGLVSDSGAWQPAQSRITSRTILRGVPSILIDSLLRQGGELAAVLGETTSATAVVDYSPGAVGSATIELDAANSRGRIAADLSPDGMVRLREPAVLSLAVTPRLSEVFLKSVNPLLVQAVGADEPITLTVDDEGFVAPLAGFDLAAVSADASLDLGTLRLDNGGLLSLVLKTLHRDQPGRLVARFTPLDFRLDGGKLRYDDMTMTIDNLVLGFAGLVNLERDTVDLTMTMPGEALRKIFQDLEGVIPPDYALVVPIRGSIDDPRVDTGAITAELARLAVKKNLGGREAEIVGALIDAILGGSGDQKRE